MTNRDKKALKDLLALDNEELNSIAPKPFKPSFLSLILSHLSPDFYTQQELAKIKNFFQQFSADIAERSSPQNNNNEEDNLDQKVAKKSRKNASPSPSNILPNNVISTLSSNASPQVLPIEFKDKIIELNGTDITLIMQKIICATDIASNNNRLSIQRSQLKRDFLTKAEKEALDERDDDNHIIGLEVKVFDPCLKEWKSLKLKKWDMQTGFTYNLSAKWNNLCHNNDLQVGDILNVWSFRVQDVLYFLLHKLPKPSQEEHA